MSRSRAWCFTLNNYTQEEYQQLTTLKDGICYTIVGKEAGEQGTPHLQGYLECTNRISMRALKTRIGLNGIHLEARRGTQAQAITYCKKEGDFVEVGNKRPGQGSRSDLQDIKRDIEEGTSEIDIASSHFNKWVIYRRSFSAYRNLLHANVSRPAPVVRVLWGPTGTGKTRRVHEALGTLWSWPGGQWFDGYSGQDNVLFDDFRGDIPFAFLLRLLDRYKLQVPVKGGFVWWYPKVIWITSNLPVEEWYTLGEDIAPLLRRITEIENMV